MKKVTLLTIGLIFSCSMGYSADLDVRKVSELQFVTQEEEVDFYEFVVTKVAKKVDGTIVNVVDNRKTQRSRITIAQIDEQIAVLQAKKDAILALKAEAVAYIAIALASQKIETETDLQFVARIRKAERDAAQSQASNRLNSQYAQIDKRYKDIAIKAHYAANPDLEETVEDLD